MKDFRTMHLSIGFVAATMIANIMSLRMIAPFGIVMDAGALLYPVTFVLRDLIHRREGLRFANSTVAASAVCNIAMFALFAITAALPADLTTGTQQEFGQVLLPGALIVLGSIAAQFISERIDGRIYHAIWKDGQGSTVKAMLVSNLITIPIDSIIMCGIAFGFTIPLASVALATASNIVIKYIVMMVTVAIVAFGEKSARKSNVEAQDGKQQDNE